MKRSLITLTILCSILFASCGEGDSSQITEEAVRTVNVKTQKIENENFTSFLKIVGTVTTSDDIIISSEVNGKIMSHNVTEGSRVTKGSLILTIDDARLKQQKAQLEAASNQAKENYERLKRIYEEDQVGSEINYLNAKYAYEQAEAQLELIKVDLENTKVRAPFSGYAETFLVQEGEMAAPGAPIVRFIGSEKFVVTAGVPARYAEVVKMNDRVRIWFDEEEPDTLTGKITYIGKSINPQNRTFRVEIELPSGGSYKVDMISNLQFTTRTENDVIVISEEFIYRKNGRFVVYVSGMDEEGNAVAKEKEVVLGPSFKTRVIVREGLDMGEDLITIGSAFLNDDMRIEIFENAELNQLNQ